MFMFSIPIKSSPSCCFESLCLCLQNGVLLRTVLDPVTGDLSDTRTRYLGSRPVKLFRVRMQGQEAVSTLHCSSLSGGLFQC